MKKYNAVEIKPESKAILLYCKSGVGKTYTCKLLAEKYPDKKFLYIGCDHTFSKLSGLKNVTIIEIESETAVQDMNDLTKEIKEIPCDVIFLDNVSELEKNILGCYGSANSKNEGIPQQGDYLRFDYKFFIILRFLKNLNKQLIITAWESLVNFSNSDGTQYSMYVPEFRNPTRSMKNVNELCGLVDVVGHIEKTKNKEGKVEWQVRLAGTNQCMAKNQLDDKGGCYPQDILEIGVNK